MSEELKEEKWENFVSREEVEEIFTAEELIDIETMDDLKEELENELEYLIKMNKLEEAVRKDVKKPKNILAYIYNFKKYLLIIKLLGYLEEDETLNKMINILSNIEKENNSNNNDENIGTQVNDKNYKKYINCRDKLIEIENLLKINGKNYILEYIDDYREMCNLKGLILRIKKDIKNYKINVDKNKKV